MSGSVYESGGRTVTRTLKRTVWPADALVGVRPLFDLKDGSDARARAGFEVIRSNANGDLLAGEHLKMTLVREYRDYRWTYDNESGWHFDYTDRYENSETRELNVGAGQTAKFDVPVDWGNYRIEIADPATGLTTKLPFFAGWSWNDENRGKEARPDKVKLALDKPTYRAGDTLKVTVTPPQAGPGLLLVESDHMLYTRNIDAKPGAVFEIPVTKDWERHDVYVTALVFRGGSALEKITPARAVGEAYVPIDRSERKIDVAIEVAAADETRDRSSGNREGAGARRQEGVRDGFGGRCRHPQHHALRAAGRERLVLRPARARRRCVRPLRSRHRKLRRQHGESFATAATCRWPHCRKRAGRPRRC